MSSRGGLFSLSAHPRSDGVQRDPYRKLARQGWQLSNRWWGRCQLTVFASVPPTAWRLWRPPWPQAPLLWWFSRLLVGHLSLDIPWAARTKSHVCCGVKRHVRLYQTFRLELCDRWSWNGTYPREECQVFLDSKSAKEDVVLRTQPQTLSDALHVSPDVQSVDVGGAGGGCFKTCSQGRHFSP